MILGDDSVGYSILKRAKENWEALAQANGTSRVPVGGWVRKLRAVEDQSAPIPEERMSKLGGIICNLVRPPEWDQHGCHSKREKQTSFERTFIFPLAIRISNRMVEYFLLERGGGNKTGR